MKILTLLTLSLVLAAVRLEGQSGTLTRESEEDDDISTSDSESQTQFIPSLPPSDSDTQPPIVPTLPISAPQALAPAITSASIASAVQGMHFSYKITASGTAPMSFEASNLPAGLRQLGGVISGVPTTAGTFRLALSASNAAGKASKDLALKVTPAADHAPALASLSAYPNPSPTAAPVRFSAQLLNGEGSSWRYAWDFGDGTKSSSTSPTKTFNAQGHYLVTLTVSNGAVSATSSMYLLVIGTAASNVLNVDRLNLNFNFVQENNDSLTVSGQLQLPDNLTTQGTTARINFGTLEKTFRIEPGHTPFELKPRKNGQTKFTLTLRNEDLYSALSALGFSKTESRQTVGVTFQITIGETNYSTQLIVQYKLNVGKSGPVKGIGRNR